MANKAWLDVSVFRCPNCGRLYPDASWYVIEMESDIECGTCHITFNAKKQLTDRAMLEFETDEKGKLLATKIAEHV